MKLLIGRKSLFYLQHFGETVALEYSSQGISQYLQSLDENSELKALDLLTDMANLVTCMSNHYEKSSEKVNLVVSTLPTFIEELMVRFITSKVLFENTSELESYRCFYSLLMVIFK